MSRWRRIVRRELARYRVETGYDVIERQSFLDQALPTLRSEFPNNSHLDQKVSQILQQLRDRDEVEFLGRGTYRVCKLGETADETGTQDERGETNDESTYSAREYVTTVGARSLPAAFREVTLDRYGHTCPVSGVDHDRLLDVAHVLPWSEYPDYRSDMGNVLPLSKTHHAAFDAGLFTLDRNSRLHVSPTFETDSSVLRTTLLERDGQPLDQLSNSPLSASYLEKRNESLSWL